MGYFVGTKCLKSDHLVLRYGSGQTKRVDGQTDGWNGRTDDAKTISL